MTILQTYNMKKYEYKVVEVKPTKGMMKLKFDFEEMESMLTGFGLKGWELLQAQQYASPSGNAFFLLFLKREIIES